LFFAVQPGPSAIIIRQSNLVRVAAAGAPNFCALFVQRRQQVELIGENSRSSPPRHSGLPNQSLTSPCELKLNARVALGSATEIPNVLLLPATPNSYSWRRATIGSTRVARTRRRSRSSQARITVCSEKCEKLSLDRRVQLGQPPTLSSGQAAHRRSRTSIQSS
jgi:hypothetical protein